MRIPQEFIDQLLSRVVLSDFIRLHVPDLKRAGNGEYKACCPFHEEHSASFTVADGKDFFHCFGCGAHGNALQFLMRPPFGRQFRQAVEELSGFVGMAVPRPERPEQSPEERQERIRRARAISALEGAQLVYANCLKSDPEGLRYAEQRGISTATIDKFGIGYARNDWHVLTGSRSFDSQALEDGGLSVKRENSTRTYDRFRARLMFPIYGYKDGIIGFGGRTVADDDPKYLNSPESMVFKKGDNLYGLKQAREAIRKANRVFVVEGYMDVVMTSQHGVKNVVASLGTAVTETQIRRLFALCDQITFCLDGDRAGQAAAWRAAENVLPHLDDKHTVDFMFLPEEMDPDDFLGKRGRGAFDAIAAAPRRLTDYILDVLLRDVDLQSSESMAFFLTRSNEMATAIQNAAMRLALQKRIAELAGVSLDRMLQMLDSSSTPKTEVAVPTEPAPANDPRRADGAGISVAAKLLATAMLKDHQVAREMEPDYLRRFMSPADLEFTLPLVGYLRANPGASVDAVVTTFAYGPYAQLVAMLQRAAGVVGPKFDAMAEARLILGTFRRMERIDELLHAASESARV